MGDSQINVPALNVNVTFGGREGVSGVVTFDVSVKFIEILLHCFCSQNIQDDYPIVLVAYPRG